MDLVRKSLLRIWTWPMSTWNVSFEIPWSISFCRRLHSSTRKAWRANASCRYSHQFLGNFEAHEADLPKFFNTCLHNGDRRLSHYPRYGRICFVHYSWQVVTGTSCARVCVAMCGSILTFSSLWCCSAIAFVYDIQVRVQYPLNKDWTDLTESSSDRWFWST